jgi:MFS family permease
MTTSAQQNPEPAADQPPLSMGEQFATFNRVFWIANTMEMIERLAYYGVRAVISVYMVLAITSGGPEFDHIQKGAIFAAWAAVQSGLPIVTGGYADRYGYKLTVAISIAIKIVGYLLMAFAVEAGSVFVGGANLGVPGHNATYWAFMGGALLLAAGTAIFKPGVQGIIAHQLNERNDSMGWSLFYQLVNVGGFLGPFLAGMMRILAWRYVFISCAVIVALNYVLLLTFAEPDSKHEGPVDTTTKTLAERVAGSCKVFADSLMGIMEPRLLAFLVVFSGFWMMFNQLFDLLPNYIDDWVDSRGVFDAILAPAFALFGTTAPEEFGGMVPFEWMINLNAGMCMTLAFFVGFLTGKVRSMTAMIAGILVSAIAIYSLGMSNNGWFILLAIAGFSMGELMASPTKMRYFSALAPPGKKGLYLGYINATGGIGWSLGSILAGTVYEAHGDKVVLARRYLVDERGVSADTVTAMSKDDVLPHLAEALGATPIEVQTLLLNSYQPNNVWLGFTVIGVLSMIGLVIYDRITQAKLSFNTEANLLTALTFTLAFLSYGFIVSWLYFDMDTGMIVFGAFWAAVFAAAMCVWRIENTYGRVVGRVSLSAFIATCAVTAWWAAWPLALAALLVTLALLTIDQIAGFLLGWEKTAV